MSANVSNKFSIKLCGKVFESNEEGMLDLNIIANALNLKSPSQWRNTDRRELQKQGMLTPSRGGYKIKGSTLANEIATKAYLNYCKLKDDFDETVTIITTRKEDSLFNLLQQIFKDIKRQYQVDKYFVDFYIPSAKLYIEYDEYYHGTHEQRIRDAERQMSIGGNFYRIKEGSEVESLVYLYQKFATSKLPQPIKTWKVDDKYHFTEEMESYKFVVSNEENFKVEESTLPDFHKEHKFIVCNKNYSKIFFPKVAASQEECIPF